MSTVLLAAACGAPMGDIDPALQQERDRAVARVQEIVNQRVASQPRTPEMQVSVFAPGWFHAGATKPDFEKVDVRQTQEIAAYAPREYATSDISPDIVYRGADLEFNAMTKYFYTDRTVPKKRLTEVEMVEINSLYRVIGRYERSVAETQARATAAREARSENLQIAGLVGGLAALGALVLWARSRGSA